MPPADALPRLLVLSSTYPRWAGDGEPGFVHELSRRLAERWAVTVLCPHAPGAARRENLDGVDVIRFRYAPAALETLVAGGGVLANLRRARWKWLLVPGFLAAQAWAAWRCVRRVRPSCVHAHWIVPQGAVMTLLSAVGVRVPWLLTVHGGDLYALQGGLLAAVKRSVLRRADAVAVVSAPMRAELERLGADPGRATVAPMGVDLERKFARDPATPRDPRELLFVGRLVEKKGLAHLLDALARLPPGHADCVLTVVGAGPEREALERRANALGLAQRVRFLGPLGQDELPALYRRAALFVAPFVTDSSGDREGLGLVVIEALGCGCPVVASDIAPLREVPSADLELVPMADPAALASAIAARLAAGAAALQDDGARLHERYDWRAASARYERLLGALAGSATDRPSTRPNAAP